MASAVETGAFDRVVLLNNRGPVAAEAYRTWLQATTGTKIEVREMGVQDVSDHGEIYEAVAPICASEIAAGSQLTYHLSPGTPAMASVWLLLGKTRFPGDMLRSSPEQGLQKANVPFDIAAELLPQLLREPAAELERHSLERAPESAAWSDILHRSKEMKAVVRMAQRVAPWPVPVLIEGESGTGKELFARAIHDASPRSKKPFVPVNCGAIPRDLVEAELFGHEEGAFTGAKKARAGHFERADGGTLFLDELGELPLDAQVKLLRALESGEIRRVGGDMIKKVDVRVVAATNRTLLDEMVAGSFREDLFYRLAVARLKLPPLRERKGDLLPLLEFAVRKVNADGASAVPGYQAKTLSPAAKNVFMNHGWPGNVRELVGTVRRAAIWTEGPTIRGEDAQRALLDDRPAQASSILGRALGESFDLEAVMGEVARHYLQRALEEANGVKSQAAKLVGFSNYQTLTNWLKKYGLEG